MQKQLHVVSVINAFWRRRGTELPLFHLIRPGPLCLSVCLSLSLSVSLSLSPSLSPPPSLSQPRWPSNYGVRLESGKPEFDSCFPRGDSLSVCLSVSLSLSLSLSLPPPPPPPPPSLSQPRWPSNYGVRLESGKFRFLLSPW